MSIKQKSPSKFKFWIPNIGFSPSLDENESKKTEQGEQKTEASQPEKESSSALSSKEKVPWYKFPKLGFSSTEKQKPEDKETEQRPEASSTITEPENIEEQTSSIEQGAQASLAEPEDFKIYETDLGGSETKSTK